MGESTVNVDCLLHIMRHLSMRDKLTCRLVCRRWQQSVDKLFCGQQSLEIIARSGGTRHLTTDDYPYSTVAKHWSAGGSTTGLGGQLWPLLGGAGGGQCPPANTTAIAVDTKRLNFSAFHFMLMKFRNIHTLTITNLMQLSDIIMFTIVENCGQLCELNFCQCRGLEFDDNNEHSIFNSLTGYGWHLLTQAYPNLSSLTLRQCRLTEPELTKIITACDRLKHLDISDNQWVGASIKHLSAGIESLVCGDLSNDESLEQILANLIAGPGRHLRSLTLSGALSPLHALQHMIELRELELHYHTDDDDEGVGAGGVTGGVLADIGHLCLHGLVLEQIRCYDQRSAVDERQFQLMLKRSPELRRLAIVGDYEWDLRLSDKSMHRLTVMCPALEDLTLTGNGLIGDTGIASLSALPLQRVTLSSFQSVTDASIQTLLQRTPVRHLTLTDMSGITENLVVRAVTLCEERRDRHLDLTLCTAHMNRKMLANLPMPGNLRVRVDTGRSNKLADDQEPSTFQMMVVIGMSALILLMALLTTIVVVLVPMAMALMMIHEYLRQCSVSVPDVMVTLFQVKSALSGQWALARQAYVKLMYT